LIEIAKLIGSLSSQDKAFLSDDEQIEHLREHEVSYEKVNFNLEFTKSQSEIPNLLQGLLEFNPFFRVSARAALQLPMFDGVRLSKLEAPPSAKVALRVDRDGVFSYSGRMKSIKYDLKDWAKMLVSEEQKVKKRL